MDFLIFSKINNLAGKSICLDGIAIFFAEYLGYILIFLLIFFLIKNFKKYWKIIALALISAVLSRFVIIEIIRWLFPKTRPFIENDVNLLLAYNPSNSLPSGHAAFFFGLAIVIFLYNKKIGALFLVSAFLISIFRIFCGVHWPSDIIAGAIVGIFSGWFVISFLRQKKAFSVGEQ